MATVNDNGHQAIMEEALRKYRIMEIASPRNHLQLKEGDGLTYWRAILTSSEIWYFRSELALTEEQQSDLARVLACAKPRGAEMYEVDDGAMQRLGLHVH